MKTTISSEKDLPLEFDLAKYEKVKQFELLDWIFNFHERLLCRFLMLRLDRKKVVKDVKKLLKKPIVIPPKNLDFYDFSFKKFTYPSHVRDMDAFTYFLSDHILEEKENYRNAYFRFRAHDQTYTEEDGKLLDTPVWQVMGDSPPIDGQRSEDDRFVIVDLQGSEEKILEDFKHWLKEARSQVKIPNIKRRFTQKDFKSWTEKKILPYLDLQNWAMSQQVKISHNLLGRTLFPDEYDIELVSRIRKVIVPLAKLVNDDAFINALASQYLEIFDKAKNSKVKEQ